MLAHVTSNIRDSIAPLNIYSIIILPVVLYRCETWSLTLREERELRMFENMVLRRIFGPRRDEVTGEWRRLHNEKLNDFYSSPNSVWVYRVLWGNRREGEHWGDLGVDGWIILGWVSRRWDLGIRTGLGCPRIETGGGRL
jgi:hypothetical protein